MSTKENHPMKKLLSFVLVTVLFLMCCGCSGQPIQEYTSPNGTHRIVIEYDMVSRPTVYEVKGGIKEHLWSYDGNGFVETVYFEIEWVSENQFYIRYDDSNDEYDEEFLVTIP